jgi:hypothetical protein
MTTKNEAAPVAEQKSARKRKTPDEQLAELETKRKQLEADAAAVKAKAQLERAIASLRNGQDFDAAVEAAQHACRLMQPFVPATDIDVEEYGDEGSK